MNHRAGMWLIGRVFCLLAICASTAVEAKQPRRLTGHEFARRLTTEPATGHEVNPAAGRAIRSAIRPPPATRIVRERYPSGFPRISGEYRSGKKSGLWTWWHPNGQKQAEGQFVEDLRSGTWTYWHANGQKKTQGEYMAGAQLGKWFAWNQDGLVERVEVFTLAEGGEDAATRIDDEPAVTDDQPHAADRPLAADRSEAGEQPMPAGSAGVDGSASVAERPATEDQPQPSPPGDAQNPTPSPDASHVPTAPLTSELRFILRHWRNR